MTDAPTPPAEDAPDAIPADAALWGGRRLDAGFWHLAWAVSLATLCGVALVLWTPSPRELAVLAVAAAPGLLAWPLARRSRAPQVIVLLWTVAAVIAGVLAGGPLRPLAALLLLAPLLAGASLGRWGTGAIGSLVAAGLVVAVHASHEFGSGLPAQTATVLGLLAVVAGAALAAGVLAGGRVHEAPPAPALHPDHDALADELARLEQAVGDLPDLALRIDAHDRADAVFGRPLDGVDAALLHAGLAQAFAEADVPALHAALAQARTAGFAEVDLYARQGRRLRLSLNRSGDQLAGILRPAPDDAPPSPPPPVAEDPALRTELAAALAARDKAQEQARTRSSFLANMSHELRTPLNAIVGFSDIMRTKLFGPLPDRYAEYAELIHESGGHLLALINDILDISKIEADKFELRLERLDARDPVSAALRLMRLQADEAGVRLRASLPSDALVVDADARALKQIALNLLSNALKFTPRGGEVDLSLGAAGGEMELTVADTGVGVSAEDLERLGRPYAQAEAGRAAGGTGLGLSLVKAMTALHGGRFILESRLGEGAAATVRMPVLAG